MVLCEGDVAHWEERPADIAQGTALPSELEGLLLSSPDAVDQLTRGLLREKDEVNQECLLLQDAWRQVREGRAEVASGELRVAEETQKLEERYCDRVHDLEAQLSSAEKRLEQLEGKLHAACA